MGRKKERARRAKREQQAVARERVTRLMDLARAAARDGKDARARRYAWLAARLNLRHQLRSPPEVRHGLCRGCHALLRPGVTARVRVRDGRVVTTCLACGRVRRRPLGLKR